MKPISKKILIISVCCMAAGAVLGIAGFLLGGRPGITITSRGLQSAASSSDPAVIQSFLSPCIIRRMLPLPLWILPTVPGT